MKAADIDIIKRMLVKRVRNWLQQELTLITINTMMLFHARITESFMPFHRCYYPGLIFLRMVKPSASLIGNIINACEVYLAKIYMVSKDYWKE